VGQGALWQGLCVLSLFACATQDEVVAKAGYEANGGGFNNALGRLKTLELVQGRGDLRDSDNLFDLGA
jgi:hypothetical protein